MPRYLMTFCYDGTCYHGWQKQHNGRSIQATMERALGRMEAPNPSITAAGRTDTGVHALAQKAHFDYPDRMSTEQMIKAFNSLLPMDIKALEIMPVPDAFHARFDACERGYRYLLAKAPNPFTRLYMGFIPHKPVFFERLGQYIPVLLGSHDFSSFGRANPNIPKRVCVLKDLQVSDMGDYLAFDLLADRFLHNMVRRIVGSLINFAAKDLAVEELGRILAMADPKQTLVETAPPEGLYLTRVGYPAEKLERGDQFPADLADDERVVTANVSFPRRRESISSQFTHLSSPFPFQTSFSRLK